MSSHLEGPAFSYTEACRASCGIRRPVPPANGGFPVGGRRPLLEGARASPRPPAVPRSAPAGAHPGPLLSAQNRGRDSTMPAALSGYPLGRGCRRYPLQHRLVLGFSGTVLSLPPKLRPPAAAAERRLTKDLSPPSAAWDWVTEGKQASSGEKPGAGWVDGCLPRCFADNLQHYGSQIKYLFTKERVNIAANTLGHFGFGAYDYFRT